MVFGPSGGPRGLWEITTNRMKLLNLGSWGDECELFIYGGSYLCTT